MIRRSAFVWQHIVVHHLLQVQYRIMSIQSPCEALITLEIGPGFNRE